MLLNSFCYHILYLVFCVSSRAAPVIYLYKQFFPLPLLFQLKPKTHPFLQTEIRYILIIIPASSQSLISVGRAELLWRGTNFLFWLHARYGPAWEFQSAKWILIEKNIWFKFDCFEPHYLHQQRHQAVAKAVHLFTDLYHRLVQLVYLFILFYYFLKISEYL